MFRKTVFHGETQNLGMWEKLLVPAFYGGGLLFIVLLLFCSYQYSSAWNVFIPLGICLFVMACFFYLQVRHKHLHNDVEQHYKEIFDMASMPIWIEDFSDIRHQLSNLRELGIGNLKDYCREHPAVFQQMLELRKVVDINPAALEMFGCSRKVDCYKKIHSFFDSRLFDVFLDAVLAMEQGQSEYALETELRNASDDRQAVLITFSQSNMEDPWKQVTVYVKELGNLHLVEKAAFERAMTKMAILNAIPVSIAMIDEKGVIQCVNEEWRRFAAVNDLQMKNFAVGVNYLDVCEVATGKSAKDAKMIAAGIRSVLRGEKSSFSMEYPCHSPEEQRWFRLTVSSLNEDHGSAVIMHVNITDCKLYEKQCLDGEKRFREMVNTIDAVVWEMDVETFDFIYVNERVEDLLGYRVEECLQPGFWKKHLYHEDRRWVPGFCLTKTMNRESHEFEYRFIRRDGDVIWLHHVVNIIVEDNQIKAMRGLLIDITERKNKELNEKLRSEIMTLITTHVSLKDVLLIIMKNLETWHPDIICNIKLCQEDPLSMIDMGNDLLSTSFANDCVMENCDLQCDLEGGAENTICSVKRTSVKDHDGASWIQPINTESGRFLGCFTITRHDKKFIPRRSEMVNVLAASKLAADVIERIRFQQRLEDVSERLRLATSSAKVGIWDYDFLTETVICNDVMYELYGMPVIVGSNRSISHWLDRMHKEDIEHLTYDFQVLSKADTDFDAEFRVVWPDKSVHYLLARASIQKNESGQPLRMIGVCWNITARREGEKRLRELNEHLEERVKARTQQLEHAKEMAETASAAKTAFISNVSHEIRTPMNSIMGMSHLALKTKLTPKQKSYLESIHKSGEHLLSLINSILDLSKIEAGKLHIDKHALSLFSMKEQLLAVFGEMAAAKGLLLNISIAPDFPAYLKGDEQRIRQILFNLVGNAVKFTAQGEVIVNIDIESETDKTYMVQFNIIDTGIGISKEHQRKLFQPFAQVDHSISRVYGGTGLGLAISMELVLLMGGELGVDSVEGQGSRFWFVCPLEKIDENERIKKIPYKREDDLSILENAKVLIVEDNEFNQMVCVDLLEQAGMSVKVADNGRAALDMLHQENFDCVLMDVQMPVMDGIEATKLIRSDMKLKGIPIIALTANALEIDRNYASKIGMNDYIAKPIEPSVLYSILVKWLDGRNLHHE